MSVEAYRQARLACELARNILKEHDIAELVRAIEHSEALGPMLDPTLYRDKRKQMEEDRRVFEGALAFLRAWEPARRKR